MVTALGYWPNVTGLSEVVTGAFVQPGLALAHPITGG